jgi:Protein of unknown function (DUF3667)
LYEFVESITHFDTKVFTTMKEMASKPGLIVKNYNNNKRARYVPPARIYIFMSFIFFFLLSVLYNQNVHTRTKNMEQDFRNSFGKESGFI